MSDQEQDEIDEPLLDRIKRTIEAYSGDMVNPEIKDIVNLLNEAGRELREADSQFVSHLAGEGCMDGVFCWQARVHGGHDKPTTIVDLCWQPGCDNEVDSYGQLFCKEHQ